MESQMNHWLRVNFFMIICSFILTLCFYLSDFFKLKRCILLRDLIMIFFFYLGFSFTSIHDSQDSRGGVGYVFNPLYHFHQFPRHLGIRRAIAAESSPLRIASSQTRTGNLWVANHKAKCPWICLLRFINISWWRIMPQ